MACSSLGDGEGDVFSDDLNAPGCWDGSYDMQPDFFAADPFRDTLRIRVQRGSRIQEVSDGISVLVNEVTDVRENRLGQDLTVTLPPGVSPPGVPVGSQCDGGPCPTSPVHIALYLHESCHNSNIVLYGLSGTIRFTELFSGDANEKDAAEKLTEAEFDIMIGNPRDAPILNAQAGRIPNQSRLQGNFRFFFERGQPGQPFPGND